MFSSICRNLKTARLEASMDRTETLIDRTLDRMITANLAGDFQAETRIAKNLSFLYQLSTETAIKMAAV
jgi:hypothetical protein